MLSNEQVADLLDDAADLLEYGGWTQGQSRDPETGAMCATAAIDRVAYTQTNYKLGAYVPMVTGLARYLNSNPVWWRSLLHPSVSEAIRNSTISNAIVGWNDDKERTAQEVLDAFRAAAKDLRG
jgi:hypothetical protein